MKQLASKKIRFVFDAEPGVAVTVAGSFNDWDAVQNPMRDNPKSGKYVATLSLPPGRYEYKFVVNGEWRIDPKCPEWVTNDFGTLNSVMCIA